MATVVENKKNGKTVSFKFRAYLGRNEIGKQVNKYTKYLADPEKNLEKLNEYVDLMNLSVAARKKMKAMGLPIRRISPQK